MARCCLLRRGARLRACPELAAQAQAFRSTRQPTQTASREAAKPQKQLCRAVLSAERV